MRSDKEIVGTLLGFDDFVSKLLNGYFDSNSVCIYWNFSFDFIVDMVLEDVTEFENTPEGRRVTKLEEILLNGSNISMVTIAQLLDHNRFFSYF